MIGRMKILMASPECYPFAKVGGLGDVVGALAKFLGQEGHDVRVFLPLYGCIDLPKNTTNYENIEVRLGGHQRICRVWKHRMEGVVYYFIEYQQYFSGQTIYANGDYNGERFAFFDKAILDICEAFHWIPDVIHCHDWTTGLIPVYLNTVYQNSPLSKVASVFTIHNLEHQGIFSPDILAYAGIPFNEFHAHSLEALGRVNFMKGALYHATKLTTVSPTYAKEIQTPYFGHGLDAVLRFKAGDLIGILNGIDDTIWNPQTDPHLEAHFSSSDLQGKQICKKAIQSKLGLPIVDVPLIGVISRLYAQKGLDIFMDVLPFIFDHMQVQVIAIGSGEPHWEHRLNELTKRFPDKMKVYIGYNNRLAHQTEAGCDLFMMPSRFEPCGLNQMYSMRYGTLPIVRATGGLLDTVENLDETKETGCGFVFDNLCPDAIYNTVGWACATYFDRPKLFRKMQKTAMLKNFGWQNAVTQYTQVYHWAIQQRNGY